jgi:hypothetical protein
MIPGGGGGGYVDPSGLIVTKGGAPLAGARVTLLHRASKDAALTAVPDGSAIMSPANRRNPDRSGPGGQFGWDVLPGFYAVTATHSGCRGPHGAAATTPLLTVPPPVTDLRLALSCPHLRRARTSLTARALLRPRGGGALVARVHTRRRGPAGMITFTSGRRVLGRAVLDPRTATASLATGLTTRPARLTASYSGDGTHGPSRARVRG